MAIKEGVKIGLTNHSDIPLLCVRLKRVVQFEN